jgi:hypothetical protein
MAEDVEDVEHVEHVSNTEALEDHGHLQERQAAEGCRPGAEHAAGGMGLPAALAVSAAFLAVWAASLAIVSRADRAFRGLVGHS